MDFICSFEIVNRRFFGSAQILREINSIGARFQFGNFNDVRLVTMITYDCPIIGFTIYNPGN